MSDQKRNLNPHKPAVAAMYVYGQEYADKGLGSMDFWDQLPDWKKRVCRDLVRRVSQAKAEDRG